MVARHFINVLLPIATILGVVANAAAADAASPDQQAAELARKAVAGPTAMDILTSLTTEVGPRLAGSEAEKRAAAWARKYFERTGFDKVWIESFPIEHGWARGVEKAEVTSPSPQPLIVTALGGSVSTPPEGLEAEIVVFKTYAALLAAPTNSLKGKIAVVTAPMTRAQDGSGYGVAVHARGAGPSDAARRGAIAFLLRSVGTDNHRVPHTGGTHYVDDAPRIPAAALSVPDAEQLERLADLGGPVRVKLVLTPRDLGAVTSQNVIAELKGRDKPDEIVLLGAHLDSWDLGTGAIDDGAGVAIVSAAAQLIHDLPQRPRRTIRIVLYGSEEPGLLGGKAYALAHKSELDRYVIVAEPDAGQGPVYKFYTGVVNPHEPTLARIRAALAPLKIAAGDNSSHGSSDVEPLVDGHVPAVTLAMDMTDYFDLHHTPDDTLDKVKPERLNQSTAAYAVFAYLAAELDGDYRAPATASGATK
ncbi:MAG TPA: M20/M25/M40 family metallo-hydrolase [Verrucomicrobiae bacterium]|nr:M20/M25/M40 family metallo-hydrolase [Verrucomicrobiae bacterium]